jgi:uncharacterized protein (DUF2267 family)
LFGRPGEGDVDERDYFRSVAERTGLSREEVTDLTRATLQALAQRLSKGTVHELVRNLPNGLGDQLRHVRGRSSRHTDLDETKKQVSGHTGLRHDEVHAGLAAVVTTMREAVPAETFDKALSQLPAQFRDLVAEEAN